MCAYWLLLYTTFPSQDIRKANFEPKEPWSISGSFKHVHQTNIWLYQHASYATCSSVKFSNFACVLGVKELALEEYPACPHDDHDYLKVYFADNRGVQKYLRYILQNNISEERRSRVVVMQQKLQAVFTSQNASGTVFETPGLPEQNGINFTENAWTKRLSLALQENFKDYVEVIYSAKEALNFASYQSKRSLLPSNEVVTHSYIFHGTPDITIIDKVLLDVTMEEEIQEGELKNSKFTMECGKQAFSVVNTHPEKLGELLANMHINTVQRVMQQLSMGERLSNTNITSRGLLLHKAICGITCSLKIPMFQINVSTENVPTERSEISVDQFEAITLDPSSLCFHIQNLLQ